VRRLSSTIAASTPSCMMQLPLFLCGTSWLCPEEGASQLAVAVIAAAVEFEGGKAWSGDVGSSS
jgi:hypothetical protein